MHHRLIMMTAFAALLGTAPLALGGTGDVVARVIADRLGPAL